MMMTGRKGRWTVDKNVISLVIVQRLSLIMVSKFDPEGEFFHLYATELLNSPV